jgi:hypothetical protein
VLVKEPPGQLEGVLLMKVYTSNILLTLLKTIMRPANFAFRLEDTYHKFTLPPAKRAFSLEDTCHKFTQYYDRIQE